jgi:hypothetical protein
VDALDPAARALLSEGRQLHVAVLTTSGPHVTPELYTYDDRHIWFLTAADTLKSRVVRRDPRVGAVIRVGSRSAVLGGDVVAYDPRDPVRLLARAGEALRALAALTSFTLRNAADLAAFTRDLAAGRLGSRLPQRRVLLRLTARQLAVLDGSALVSTDGEWPGRITVPGDAPPLRGDVDCVLAVADGDRMAVLPGRASTALTEADVAGAGVQLTGLGASADLAAALVVDDYNAPGPAAKRGTLLRGRVSLRYDGALCAVRLSPDRHTTWDGVDTHTRSAS